MCHLQRVVQNDSLLCLFGLDGVVLFHRIAKFVLSVFQHRLRRKRRGGVRSRFVSVSVTTSSLNFYRGSFYLSVSVCLLQSLLYSCASLCTVPQSLWLCVSLSQLQPLLCICVCLYDSRALSVSLYRAICLCPLWLCVSVSPSAPFTLYSYRRSRKALTVST